MKYYNKVWKVHNVFFSSFELNFLNLFIFKYFNNKNIYMFFGGNGGHSISASNGLL